MSIADKGHTVNKGQGSILTHFSTQIGINLPQSLISYKVILMLLKSIIKCYTMFNRLQQVLYRLWVQIML
jgi:hypothetical protein